MIDQELHRFPIVRLELPIHLVRERFELDDQIAISAQVRATRLGELHERHLAAMLWELLEEPADTWEHGSLPTRLPQSSTREAHQESSQEQTAEHEKGRNDDPERPPWSAEGLSAIEATKKENML